MYGVGLGSEFEGEYLNGLKNGKAKSYNENNHLIIECGYLNGKRNGKMKEFNDKGELIFEGEYLNGIIKSKNDNK